VTFEQKAQEKQKVLNTIKILEDFSSSVLVLKKRSEKEMQTPEMLEKLKADTSPDVQVKAQFDDEMQFKLRPAVFQKLCKIGTLFLEGKKPLLHYKKKMLKKLERSSFHGQVKMVTTFGVQQGTAALIAPRKIYFWPENAPEH